MDYKKIENEQLMDLVFDSSVNHGKQRTIRWIQIILNIKSDGILGPITLQNINKNTEFVYYELVKIRIKFYTELSNKNPGKYQKFLSGWINRICEFVKGYENDN